MSQLTRDELLILLIEECGEVIRAATKCLRFGWDVDHGVEYGNNRDQLAKEMGELDERIKSVIDQEKRGAETDSAFAELEQRGAERGDGIGRD